MPATPKVFTRLLACLFALAWILDVFLALTISPLSSDLSECNKSLVAENNPVSH